LLIGVTLFYTYKALSGGNGAMAAAAAGVVGTLTNTILVVGALVGFGLIPAAAIPTIVPQALVEVVLAAIITVLVAQGVNLVRSGRTTAADTKDGNY
jgi:uncharacterized membrane protein